MDGRTHGRIEEWMDTGMDGGMYRTGGGGHVDTQGEKTDGWTSGWMDERKEGQMHMDEQMDG